MGIVNIRDKLYLYGGSGPSASCFNDLQVFDPINNTWNITTIINEN